MRRVLILGSPGSGKSTLARKLGAATGLPVIHLDAVFWRPGWIEPDREEFRARVAEVVGTDQWIIDGDYGSTLDIRLACADTAIVLEVSRVHCLWRVLRRRLVYMRGQRPDMAPGCPERLDPEFLRYIWSYPASRRDQRAALLRRYAPSVRVITLESQHEVNELLT